VKMALVATVVPCITQPICAGSMAAMPQIRSMPLSTATEGLWGVEGTLAVKLSPVSSLISSRSVKVPPTSTPKRKLMSALQALPDFVGLAASQGGQASHVSACDFIQFAQVDVVRGDTGGVHGGAFTQDEDGAVAPLVIQGEAGCRGNGGVAVAQGDGLEVVV